MTRKEFFEILDKAGVITDCDYLLTIIANRCWDISVEAMKKGNNATAEDYSTMALIIGEEMKNRGY